MSESKKPPRVPPPDDFSETAVNIDIPDEDAGDWDKTSYNTPTPAAPVDDWGKTVINYDSSLESSDEDSEDDHRPGKRPEEPDWGMTQANVNLGGAFEAADDDFGDEPVDNSATQHVIHIPELDRKKFQIPQTPTEKAKEQEKQDKAKGGVPAWFWISAGLMAMFFFAVVVLLAVYFLIIQNTGYELIVKGAPIGSDFQVDGASWGVPSTKNEHRLAGLGEGTRKIDIKHPNYTCQQQSVVLENSRNPAPIIAICSRTGGTGNNTTPPLDEKACDETRKVEDREACAEQILDTLGSPPDLDRLVKALNWLIINFESGKWDIPEARKRILTKAATHMKNLDERVRIEIGGHTDDVGQVADNKVLSEKRATAVKDFLVNIADVSPTLLTTHGYGYEKPKTRETTPTARFDNRRIEYTVMTR